jgi:hypothetical protein
VYQMLPERQLNSQDDHVGLYVGVGGKSWCLYAVYLTTLFQLLNECVMSDL